MEVLILTPADPVNVTFCPGFFHVTQRPGVLRGRAVQQAVSFEAQRNPLDVFVFEGNLNVTRSSQKARNQWATED